jgi:type VII secretion protein EccE
VSAADLPPAIRPAKPTVYSSNASAAAANPAPYASTAPPSTQAAAASHAAAATAQAQATAHAATATARASAATATARASAATAAAASVAQARTATSTDAAVHSLLGAEPRRNAQSDASIAPPARPQAHRRPATIGGLHLGQIVCWEAAVAAVIASLGRPIALLAAVSVVAATTLLITMVRARQRWLYQWIGVYGRYLLRDRTHPLDHGGDRATELLAAVARGGVASSIDVDGQAVGMIEHVGGVTALLEPTPAESGLVVEQATTLPSPVTLLPFAEVGDPIVTAQIVIQAMSAPAPGTESSAPGASYQQLTGGRVPAQRRAWIALQVMRPVDGCSDAELRQSLSSAVRRLQRRLSKEGTPARALDRADALAALLKLTHLDGGATAQHAEVRERWSAWLAGSVPQACFRIRTWPDLAAPAGRELIDRLVSVTSRTTTVALATRRAGTEIEIEAVIRIAADDATQLEVAAKALAAAAASSGASLERLDGEHVHGVAASLPLGGFLP